MSTTILKSVRAPVRTSFTKALKELQDELRKDAPDKTLLKQLFRRLVSHKEKLSELDEKIELQLLTDGAIAEVFSAEYDGTSIYVTQFTDIAILMEPFMSEGDGDRPPSPISNTSGGSGSHAGGQRKT